MERAELTSSLAPAAAMSESLATARKPWTAPSVLPVAVDGITQAAVAIGADLGSLDS